jgi:hypothetical protein
MSKPINMSYSNTLISAQQPIQQYKHSSSAGIIGGMSRPNVNLGHNPTTTPEENYNNAIQFIGPFSRPYPMKHWRRQLNMNNNRGKSAISISVVDRPGGTVFRGYTGQDGCTCEDSNDNLYITFDDKFLQSPYKSIKPSSSIPLSEDTHVNKIQNNGAIQVGPVDGTNSYEIQTGIYNTKNICCTPENNIIKSAVTLLSKSYYSDSKAYLKARCKLYDQKQTIQEISGNTYDSPIISNNSVEFKTNNCSYPSQTGKTNTCNVSIYKPSNAQFATRGAVDNGTRLAKLKYDTITKNGSSFASAWGQQGANAGKYHGTSTSPYFLKSKYQAPVAYRRNGQNMSCTQSGKNCETSQTLPSFWGSIN